MKHQWLITATAGFLLGIIATLILKPFIVDAIVPHNMMGPVAIIRPADYARGYLGLTFSNEPGRSLIIVEINRPDPPDSPHLHPLDQVTAIDDHAVATYVDLMQFLSTTKPHQSVTLTLLRNNDPQTLTIPLLSLQDLREFLRTH